jgi:RimJ/RimL family protein N-acetyltransferase
MTMDIETSRLILHAVDESEARRVLARAPGPSDAWAADYPFAGDIAAIDSFLRATEQHGEQRPFGYYQIIRAADGLAVGGAGFKGPPDDGSIEVGYGLAPSARGHGYASEAVTALLILAAENGVDTVLANTTDDNVASQRTLVSAGFTLVGTHAGLHRYRAGAPGPLHTEGLPK